MAIDSTKIKKFAEKGKIKKLIPLAVNKNADIRLDAAKAFGIVKGDEAFNQLVLLLEDSDLGVRTEAARALGIHGDKKGMEHLRHASSKNDDKEFLEVAKASMATIRTEND